MPTDFVNEPHVRPMDFTGRPMRGFLYVDPAGTKTAATLRQWVERATAYAEAQPVKTAISGKAEAANVSPGSAEMQAENRVDETEWDQSNRWRKPVARGVLLVLRYRPRERSELHPSSHPIEPPTAHAVGILAITFVNHWLTPVVGS